MIVPLIIILNTDQANIPNDEAVSDECEPMFYECVSESAVSSQQNESSFRPSLLYKVSPCHEYTLDLDHPPTALL
jgi:hypothetical protein